MTMMLQAQTNNNADFEGIIPIYKPRGMTAFHLVRLLRKHLRIKKIGHAGTLDPFAEGVMVMLVGRNFTKLSDLLLNSDKEYTTRVHLGLTTDTYDCDGEITHKSDVVPTFDEVREKIKAFQGKIQQIPPMYSAKKVNGKKLYELARKGKVIERNPATIEISTEILAYEYPFLDLKVRCSKGTYIRSIAHDLGVLLGCGGHLITLIRTRSGCFELNDCFEGENLLSDQFKPQDLIPTIFDQSRLPSISRETIPS
jgi:tRNA pseudouridine55 synthase